MIDSHQANEQWLFYKLYLGTTYDRIEQVLLHLRPRLQELVGIERWFFIRYVDEGGMHLRLRILPRSATVPATRSAIEAILTDLCKAAPGYAASAYKPMVSFPETWHDDAGAKGTRQGPHFVSGNYVAEYDKYGGPAGMPIAEQCFMVSSEIALTVLGDELQDLYSRKTLVPLLMRTCLRIFDPLPAPTFWHRYCMFWMGGDTPAANDWYQKFLHNAEQLRLGGVAVSAADASLPAEARRVLDDWRTALEGAKTSYAALALPVSANVLCFNFIHMMNNRLGLSPLEESYMATLLEQNDPQVKA